MTTRVRAEMPVHPPVVHRERAWWIGVLGLVLLLAWSVYGTIVQSREPGFYWAHHHDPATWTYPAERVRTWVTAMAIECAIAVAVLALRVRYPLSDRALWLCVAFLAGGFLMTPMAMHAGPPFTGHYAWLATSFAWMLVFALGLRLAAKLRARRAPPS